MLTCRTSSPGESYITDTNTGFLQERLAVAIVITRWAASSFRATRWRIYHFQWVFEVVHVFVVGNLSYAASEARVVEFRIRNGRVFNASDLKWPKTVQVTV